MATPERGFPADFFAARYEVQQEFRGGEGCTALLRDRRTNKDLIAKVLDADVPAAEAALLLSLRHPAIPAIREVGQTTDGRVFLLREFARGRPLSELLPLSVEQALQVARQILEVLAFVHLRGALHLDLKPANLIVDEDFRLQLLDFGLGVRRGRKSLGGTPFFAAPEVLLGGTPDPRSDLFSLGAVLVTALWPGAGPVPLSRFLRMFPGSDFFAAADIRAEQFPAPFAEFLQRCLSRRPQRRFADAQAALEFLVGGAGRPADSLLQPDLVAIHGPGLEQALAGRSEDVLLRGGSDLEREQLAVHLLCVDPSVARYETSPDAVRIVRGGGEAIEWSLPPLDADRLAPFLGEVLSLQGDVARAAAAFLLAEVGPSASAIGYDLMRRAAEGQIVPDGTRWIWPAAAQGRLASAPPAPRGPLTAEWLRQEAARGRGSAAARRLATASADLDPQSEQALRRALAQGLLRAGEPARALPLCADLPLERAQSLLDLGRIEEARAALPAPESLPADAGPDLRRPLARTAARIRAAAGDVEAALADLRASLADQPEPVDTQILAALHEQLGNAATAQTLLRSVLPKLPAESEPFARAAALTSLGLVERRLGRHDEAHRLLGESRELLLRLGHARHAATATHNLGLATRDLGRLQEATEHFRQARGLFAHAGDKQGAAIAEAALAGTELRAGDALSAERRLRPAIESLDRIGAGAAAAQARVLLCRALAAQRRTDMAREVLGQLDAASKARLAAELTDLEGMLRHATAPPTPPAPDRPPTPPPNPGKAVQDNTGPSRELFRTFLAVNRRLAQESNLDEAMRMLLESAITLCGGRTGYLLVSRPDGLQREFQAGAATSGGHAFSRSLANRAMQQQRTLTGDDALADRELQEMPSIRNLQVRSAICAPFVSGTGAGGAIYVEHSGRSGVFSDMDKESLEVLADQAAIAVDRMLREEQLAQELEHSRRELAVAQRSRSRETTTLIGDSRPMRELRSQIQKVAPLDLSVLILGETGTGKELVAQSIHQNSEMRSRGPFVAENCSALPAELMERELFGHVAGSFTGADRDRPGLLELASGGTLFLDEVGDMPPLLQAKLLRALQEKHIRRIGGSETIAVDVRILAATHKDLRAMVQSGEFREDLYFRLAAVELQVPPLRTREGDVATLASHFLKLACKEQGLQRSLSDRALQQLAAYRFPGNVRELQHVIARAMLLADGEAIDDLQLPQASASDATDALGPTASATPTFSWPAVPLMEAEKRTIEAALRQCEGDKSATARLLQISRTALYEKIKRHGI